MRCIGGTAHGRRFSSDAPFAVLCTATRRGFVFSRYQKRLLADGGSYWGWVCDTWT